MQIKTSRTGPLVTGMIKRAEAGEMADTGLESRAELQTEVTMDDVQTNGVNAG